MFLLYAFVNGMVVICSFLIGKFIYILLAVMAIFFVKWELAENHDEYIDDQRRLV